jgi:hypothetical protein
MHFRTIQRLAAILPLLVLGCGDSPSEPGGGSGYSMSARINGETWTADPALIYAAANVDGMPGFLTFQGSNLSGGGWSIAIHVSRIPGPGTYPMGMNIGTGTGGVAVHSSGSQAWNTPLNGAAGSITISSITGTSVTGTFQYQAEFVGAGSGGPATVTEGKFHVPLNPGFVAATADELGNRMTGTIAGSVWNAATVVGVGAPQTLWTTNASNGIYSVSLSAGPVTGPGSAPLGTGVPVRRVSVQRIGSPGGWGGTTLDTGTVTITSLSATRIAGTISGTLSPVAGAVGTLTIENMQFDVRLTP